MSDAARYNFPTTIHVGAGVRSLLPDLLAAHGVRSPQIVTDRGLAALPIIGELRQALADSGLAATVFSAIWGNPVKMHVEAGAEAYRTAGNDAVVAVGGGAAMDVAKCIALMVNHPGDLFDYEDGKSDGRPVDQPIPCLVALPTTAGTGSEVGRSAVISDDTTHVKRIVFDPKLLPVAVLADPELTVGLPADITAATGLDALTHLVEAYLAKGHHPMCDGIALEGLRLVHRSLVTAVSAARRSEGPTAEHLAARRDMLDAAMMGAVAFQKGLGVTHSCAHALSAVCDMHHGLANAVMLPYAMKLNIKAVPERFEQMANTVGITGGGAQFIAWLEELNRDLDIPSGLTSAGIASDHLDRLVEVATEDVCHQSNPCAVGRDDFVALFEVAFAL